VAGLRNDATQAAFYQSPHSDSLARGFVAGVADFVPKARARAGELREEMKQASQEIAKDPARMRAAESEGIAPQVKNFVRQAERERGREKGRGIEKDQGLER
jgi:hypothetical protein